MTVLTADCPAKINLGLEVTGRRTDGYHELVTIFQAISLAETVSVEPGDDLVLTCSDDTLATTDNLCLRTAERLRAVAGTRQGARIHLEKRIPVAAGLGGGSSNAASTLRLLNELWQAGLTDDALAALAVELGADVPFFLNGATALATGIGEVLEPVPAPSMTWLVLLRPDLDLTSKTARLYRALTRDDWSDGTRTLAQADRLRAGGDLDPALLTNVFARPLLAEYAAVRTAEEALRAAGARVIFPAGSGPTLVALCEDEPAAEKLAAAVQAPDRFVTVAQTLTAR